MFGKPIISVECDLDGCQAPSLRTQLQAARERMEVLEKALKQGAAWFHEYAVGHAAKGTADGDEKSQRNIERSAFLRDAALSPAPDTRKE